MSIHSTAIIGAQVELSDDISIGPFTVITGKVKIGRGTVIESHASIGSEHGIVEIGEDNHIYQGAVVGGPPQDLKYNNEPTKLIIGNKNKIREFATLNIGTMKGTGETIVGNNNLLMAYVHIAHDCILADNIVVANCTQFAGHVEVEDNAVIGGFGAISQFTRLGKYCYIGADSAINKDIPPFAIAEGRWAVVRATNKIGLERSGLDKDEVKNIHKAIRILVKGDHTISEALNVIKSDCQPSDNIKYLLDFVENSKKGIAR